MHIPRLSLVQTPFRFLLLSLLSLPACVALAQGDNRTTTTPNVIVIYTDDKCNTAHC